MFNPRDTEVVICILFVLLKWKIGYSKTAMKELKPYNSIVKIITIVFPWFLYIEYFQPIWCDSLNIII